MLDRFRLDGRVAVVTGAGRGIGAATAVALAEAGADVVIAARSPDQLEATATAIETAGRSAHVVLADLSDTAEAARLSGAAREAFGRLDVVVNNVGGAVRGRSSIPPPRHWKRLSASTSRPPTH